LGGAKNNFDAAKFFLEFVGDWIFTLGILEKRTVGAAAGKAGGGPRAAFVVSAIIRACNR